MQFQHAKVKLGSKYLFGEIEKFPFQRFSGILQQKQGVN